MERVAEKQNTLDARGLKCPLPLLKMRQALRQMERGQELCVIADDAGSSEDIPRWLETSPHQLLQLHRVGDRFDIHVKCGEG